MQSNQNLLFKCFTNKIKNASPIFIYIEAQNLPINGYKYEKP